MLLLRPPVLGLCRGQHHILGLLKQPIDELNPSKIKNEAHTLIEIYIGLWHFYGTPRPAPASRCQGETEKKNESLIRASHKYQSIAYALVGDVYGRAYGQGNQQPLW